MHSVTTKHNYHTALQHLILFSIKYQQTNPQPALNETTPRHQALPFEIRDVPARKQTGV
jgi:hypothetical protein